MLVDSSKSLEVPVVAAGLAEAKVDKTLYCWYCGQAGHIKKDCPSKLKQTHTIGNLKRKPVVPVKDSMKGHVIIYRSN